MISKLMNDLIKINKLSSTLFSFILIFILFSISSFAGERLYNGATRIPVNLTARRILHADINNDGNMDLIIEKITSQVTTKLNNGDGTFTFGPTLTVGSFYESAFTVGDVNNDGFVDIIAGTKASTIAIGINNQVGGFNFVYYVAIPADANGLEIIDFDGQHGVDIAFSMQGKNGVGVLLSTGIGASFTDSSMITETLPYPTLSSANGITEIQEGLSTADVDGINGIDLISMANSSSNGYAVIWHNNGDGTFSSFPDTIALLAKPIVIISDDFDQDGYVDLLSTDFTGRASILLNNNYNGFKPIINIRADLNNQSIRELHVVDINFDTYPDIIFPTIESLQGDYKTDVFYNDGTGRFGNQETFYVGGQWIAIGDLNNDGLYDISGVTTNANALIISYGDAPGSFFKPGIPHKGEATALATGDLNNDGRVDIVSSHNRFYFIHLQNLDGSFTGTSIFGTAPYRLKQIKIVDLNNDNNLDLVGLATGRRFVTLGNGDGTFGVNTPYPTSSSLNSDEYLFLDDFTNDGYIDLITKQTTATSGLMLYVNNQDGTFATPTSINVINSNVNFGDINNDNIPDLVSSVNDTVYVKFNDGTGNFPNNNIILNGSGGTHIGDYNNDNLQDILVSTHSYINNGDSTFTDSLLSGLSISSILEMSDLDADGDNDFLSSSIGAIRTFINDGSNSFSTDLYYMNRNLQTTTATDFNNDGLLDVIMGYGVPNVNSNFSKDLMFIAYNNGSGSDTCFSLFDYDSDGHKDDCDNCPTIANPAQEDGNLDGIGNSCSYSGNTPGGVGVPIVLGDATVTFQNVFAAGTTEMTVTTSGPTAPAGFTIFPFSPASYYNISTTAMYNNDTIIICIDYDDSNLSSLQEDRLSLNHFTGSVWEDITAAKDTVNNIICGRTLTLSPFAIGLTKIPTDVEEIVGRLLPNSVMLSDNYPNPFNPSTTIEFSIPTRSFVTLTVYNMLGQVVKTLVDQNMPVGTFSATWDSDNNSGKHVASGVYLYKLTVGENIITKKMMLLK